MGLLMRLERLERTVGGDGGWCPQCPERVLVVDEGDPPQGDGLDGEPEPCDHGLLRRVTVVEVVQLPPELWRDGPLLATDEA